MTWYSTLGCTARYFPVGLPVVSAGSTVNTFPSTPGGMNAYSVQILWQSGDFPTQVCSHLYYTSYPRSQSLHHRIRAYVEITNNLTLYPGSHYNRYLDCYLDNNAWIKHTWESWHRNWGSDCSIGSCDRSLDVLSLWQAPRTRSPSQCRFSIPPEQS